MTHHSSHHITHLHISAGAHPLTPFSPVCSRTPVIHHTHHHLNAHRAPTLASPRITKNAFITLHHFSAPQCTQIFHGKCALSRSEYMHGISNIWILASTQKRTVVYPPYPVIYEIVWHRSLNSPNWPAKLIYICVYIQNCKYNQKIWYIKIWFDIFYCKIFANTERLCDDYTKQKKVTAHHCEITLSP